jgi:2-amino-4-hydroxy-6-hydroxymethyldihydropteridine diphosphokinase
VGRPERIIEQAVAALECGDVDVFDVSPTISTAPLGPSHHRYANAAAVLSTSLSPPELLAFLQSVEAHFGRVRLGQPWRARTLDIDIILWSGGIWVSDDPLVIPHMAARDRGFVLSPAVTIASDWRDPLTGFSIRQLFHRLNRAKPLDRLKKRH